MSFTHLNVHSWYSRNGALASPEALCLRAREYGMEAMALTDRDGLYGMHAFLEAARDAGLRPVIGCELTDERARLLCWVATQEGFGNLCRLISLRHCHAGFSLQAMVPRYHRGLILASDHQELLSCFKRLRIPDLYVELSPGYRLHEGYAFARRSRIPPVATHRVNFLEKDDYEDHRLLCAIHQNQKLSRLPPEAHAHPEGFFRDETWIRAHFPHAPEALENTERIVSRCEVPSETLRVVFPDLGNQRQKLYELALEGLAWRYGSVTPQALSRLDHEMAIIGSMGFSDYFLVVHDIVGKSSLTCGRGSAAASLVAYALGITHVDPIKHRLHFERFLNLSRRDPPDIDVDFAWDERDAVLDYVFSKYQARRVAMVANHVTLSDRSAMREVAKVHGFPEAEVSRFTRKMKRPGTGGEDPSQARMAALSSSAARLQGVFRYLSVHCGGVVIVPGDIRDHAPVEITPKGVPVLQWDKEGAEAAGLVKIDLLGNRSLAVIRDALRAVAAAGGPSLDYRSLDPMSDTATLSLFYTGQTMGVFYFESPATRLLLQKVGKSFSFEAYCQRDHFECHTQVTSIIRPASNAFIHEWVLRLRGKSWEPAHPSLREVLGETLGIMIYQEQLSLTAMHLAGFSAAEADTLRKVISKKHRGKRLEDFYCRFVKGGRERGVADAVIGSVWDMMASFSGYSFCKPHSASYTLVAYKSAWLRAHYPAEFMAAVLSNQGGYYSALAYLSECRRMGLEILTPDINQSSVPYTGQGRAVRVGLMQIQGLSGESARQVMKVREEGGLFLSFAEFFARVTLVPSQVKRLVQAGCFDALHGEAARPRLLWQIALRSDAGNAEPDLWAVPAAAPPQCVPPYSRERLQEQELEALGFPLRCHPLDLFEKVLRDYPQRVPASQIADCVGKSVCLAGWLVTSKWVLTRRDEPMAFVTFEDQTALLETIFFPDAYRRYARLLGEPRPYLLWGKVEEDQGTVSVHVSTLKLL